LEELETLHAVKAKWGSLLFGPIRALKSAIEESTQQDAQSLQASSQLGFEDNA
jgi:hypothetical protein